MFDQLMKWANGGSDYSYMTIIHCMDGDWTWININTFMNLAVSVAYLCFCIQMFCAAKIMHTKRQKFTIYALVVVFMLCSICGYWWDIIRLAFPVFRLHAILVGALAICTWVMVFAEWYTGAIRAYFQKMEAVIRDQTNMMAQIEEYRLAIAIKQKAADDAP